MKLWKESQEEVRRVKSDKEMARSILNMIDLRIKALDLKLKHKTDFASLIVEDYYEIIKEATTALMAIDGYKTLSHEVLVGYLKEFYPQFSGWEIALADQLRKLRHRITYQGFFVTQDFIQRNEGGIRRLVRKLMRILKDRLREESK